MRTPLPLAALAMAWTHVGQAAAETAQPGFTSLSGCYLDEKPGCRQRRARHNQAVYGVPPIDRMQRQGLEVRRIFWVRSDGRDAGMLTMWRRPGQTPRAVYKLPSPRRLAPVETEIPIPLWEEIRANWRRVDMVYLRSAEQQAEEEICFHPWLIGFEAAEPASAAGPGLVQRRSTHVCTGSVGPDFSWWVDERVAALIPACARLTDVSHKLSGCASLRGNRDAASQVAAVLARVLEPGDAEEEKLAEAAFLKTAELQRWRGLFQKHDDLNAHAERVTGRDPQLVEVRGTLRFFQPAEPDKADGVEFSAPFTQIWRLGTDGKFKIDRLDVGRFRPNAD